MSREDDERRETQCHSLSSPLGPIHVYSRGGEPTRIAISCQKCEAPLGADPPPARVSAVMECIARYFAAEEFPREVAQSLLSDPRFTAFQKKVYAVVMAIRPGDTLSYGEVAARSGFPGAVRAVGTAMRRNPFPILIPCHRVIRGDGSLGGYSGPPHAKSWLLEHEGLTVERLSRGLRLKGKAG